MANGTETNGQTALRIGWGDKSLSIKGAATIVFFMWLALITAGLYSNYRLEQAFVGNLMKAEAEHREITRSNEQTACVVTMTPADRERFRMEFRPGAWSRWCPWIKE